MQARDTATQDLLSASGKPWPCLKVTELPPHPRLVTIFRCHSWPFSSWPFSFPIFIFAVSSQSSPLTSVSCTYSFLYDHKLSQSWAPWLPLLLQSTCFDPTFSFWSLSLRTFINPQLSSSPLCTVWYIHLTCNSHCICRLCSSFPKSLVGC